MDALLLRDSPEKLDLDLNNIYQNLQGIDESSIAELLAFKRNLEQDLLSYMVPSNVPAAMPPPSGSTKPHAVAVKQLSQEQIFSYFCLKNSSTGGEYVFPDFSPPDSPGGGCSEWLARAMNLGFDIFRTKAADITQLINMIIMDVIGRLPAYDPVRILQSGDTLIAPIRMDWTRQRIKLRSHKETTMCSTIDNAGSTKQVIGFINGAFSAGYRIPATSTQCLSFTRSYLVILRVRVPLRRIGSSYNETVSDELSAYMGMMHHAQEGWYRRMDGTREEFGMGAGYGVVSNGDWFVFQFLDSEMKIQRSPVLNTVPDFLRIVQYFHYIFTAIAADAEKIVLPL